MPYLKACLDSILTQTYESWELIAINDGSSDESKAILQSYADVDPRISTYDNDGKGIIPALQLAHSQSDGQLITRMDADDIMTTDKLEVMVQSLSDKKEQIAVGLVKYFADDGQLGDGYRKYQDWLNELTSTGNNFTEIYKECVIPSPCWMMHRTDFEAIGGFDSGRYPEDYNLAFRMYAAGYKVMPCDKVIHHWRDYATRASRTDDNYADNRFLDIKVYYFLKLDYRSDQILILWGAGKKGKLIARKLIDRNIPFRWICDNPNKIGRDIYGVVLEGTDYLNIINSAQIIGAVAGDDGKEIKSQIAQANSELKAFWFC